MPRLFVSKDQLGGDTAELDETAHRHLVKALRLSPGDDVVLFDGEGHEIDARITAVRARSVTVALGQRRTVTLVPVNITLVQGVPRGERMDLIVQKATELGVTRIVPTRTARTQGVPVDRRRRWHTIAQEAARQCGRADVPVVDDVQSLPGALAAVAGVAQKFVVWEGESGRPLRIAVSGGQDVALLIGPEGGLAQTEVDAARAAGCVSVGLGPRILRTETAAIVAVTLALAACGGLE